MLRNEHYDFGSCLSAGMRILRPPTDGEASEPVTTVRIRRGELADRSYELALRTFPIFRQLKV